MKSNQFNALLYWILSVGFIVVIKVRDNPSVGDYILLVLSFCLYCFYVAKEGSQ